ncbi:hypothetical protein [Rhizobium tropici]|uniref:Uncharacterized protein n=1 Tax=Rhizobium tropici TaxID=398 RepID=A0A329Y1V5_RHITR|nr:hypothetical protein [Rhizobium tropici]RAX37871.1 hypothetical protein DQ393_29735 [Rhizobium tropici]
MARLVHLAVATVTALSLPVSWEIPAPLELHAGHLEEEVPFSATDTKAATAGTRTVSPYDLLLEWNGDVLWAPATESNDPVTKFGDEARSVFGPIPDGVCTGPNSRPIGIEVGGNAVKLEPNPSKAGAPLEFVHRDVEGRLVKWTTAVDRCDKPSLAGGVTFCAMNSRVGRVARDHVQWLFLCRKSSESLEIVPDTYWTEMDPRFSRYSAIGFNDVTGEIAFLDGRKDRSVFDWRERFPPPGGTSYGDSAGRRAAEELYDGSAKVDCVLCHDNKKPTVIDPHMQQARVGYFGSRHDPRAAFSMGNFLPGRVARQGLPFRVIGSGYAAIHAGTLLDARSVLIDGHPCSGCHSLTTLESGRRFAADATGKTPVIPNATVMQNAALFAQKMALGLVQNHRTEWASASGAGRISPWMTPEHGGNLWKGVQTLSDEDWLRLTRCAWGVGGSECGYRPLFTPCPPPGGGGDTFLPADFSADVRSQATAANGVQKILRLSWKYLNGYGNVPTRDDVRFNVAFKTMDVSLVRGPPGQQEYPTIDEAKGMGFVAAAGGVGRSGSATLLKDVSFAGHKKWTDPVPSNIARLYSIDIPAACGMRYLFRIEPKRFCFDNSEIRFSETEYLLYKDIDCRR